MLIGIIILSVTLSVDALFAGLSYGFSGTRMPLSSKLIICAFSVAYCALALVLGGAVAGLLSPFAGKIIGAAILALLGIFMIIKTQIKKKNVNEKHGDENNTRTLCRIIIKSLGITVEILKNNPEAGDMDLSGVIDRKEATLLGFALSVDSLGAGIGSAVSGLCSWYIPPAVGLCQLAFLSAGIFIGGMLRGRCEAFPEKYDNLMSILPGIMLIALSVLRLL